MVSSTSFIEVVRIDRNPTTLTEYACSVTPALDNEYGITGTVATNAPTWFNSRADFSPGTYRIQYVGSTKYNRPIATIPRYCTSCSDYSWNSGSIPEPSNTTAPVDLTKWTSAVFVDKQKTSTWIVGKPTNIVTQTDNNAPAFLFSDAVFPQTVFTARMGVYDGGNDDDFIGVAFAINLDGLTPKDYYLLSWKKAAGNNYGVTGEEGFRLLKVTGISNQITATMRRLLWDCENWSDTAGARIQVLAKDETIAWETSTNYNVTIRYKGDGDIHVEVNRERDNATIWSVEVIDPVPLPLGRIALYCHSQAQVRYSAYISSGIQHLVEGPTGIVCTANQRAITFNGDSDDIVIMLQADANYTVNAQSVNGPISFTIPDEHIIFNNTKGFIVGSTAGAYAPFTSQKTLQTPTKTFTYPEGSATNIGTGQITDLIDAGFNVQSWNTPISIAQLAKLRWFEKDQSIRFKFLLIPCGYGLATIKSISCVPVPSALVVANPIPVVIQPNNTWKIVSGLSTRVIGEAPSNVGTSTTFNLPSAKSIGVRFDITKTGLSKPVFRLVPVTYTITDPRQIEFAATNSTTKGVVYHFAISDGTTTLDTRTSTGIVYLSISGNMFPPDGLSLNPKSHVNVKCNWPFNTESTHLSVEVYADDVVVDTVSVLLEPRSFTSSSLRVNRDLVDPYITQRVRDIMWSRGISPNLYTPYTYYNNQLTLASVSDNLSLGAVLICAEASITDQTQILRSIQDRLRILPNRHV